LVMCFVRWELKVRQVLFWNLSMYYEKPRFRVLFSVLLIENDEKPILYLIYT